VGGVEGTGAITIPLAITVAPWTFGQMALLVDTAPVDGPDIDWPDIDWSGVDWPDIDGAGVEGPDPDRAVPVIASPMAVEVDFGAG